MILYKKAPSLALGVILFGAILFCEALHLCGLINTVGVGDQLRMIFHIITDTL